MVGPAAGSVMAVVEDVVDEGMDVEVVPADRGLESQFKSMTV